MTIGLSYTGSKEKHDNYRRWLTKTSPSINLISFSAEPAENEGTLEQCDGLLLSGGLDIHPSYYHSSDLDYANRPSRFYEKRDALEAALFSAAQQRGLPVLGVCRGMQLINCLLGGTLRNDLGPQNCMHKAVVNEHHHQFDKVHGVHLLPGTMLNDAGGSHAAVNSAHHQCVQELAAGLVANAVSDDGITEGLEWKQPAGKPFLLCVQWHPERMFEFDLEETALSAGIRRLFIDAIQTSMQS